jgi:mRNA-degrading endonuclease HigB of HigAB toxin-antitoxin module
MNSKTAERFWKCYSELPATIRKHAKEAYKQFQEDPYYPSLHFKQVHSTRPIFSVRITKDYRAVGIIQGEDIIWFWIGTHSEYDKILKQLRRT